MNKILVFSLIVLVFAFAAFSAANAQSPAYQVYLPLVVGGSGTQVPPTVTPTPTIHPTITVTPTPTATPVVQRNNTAFGIAFEDTDALSASFTGAAFADVKLSLSWAEVAPSPDARVWQNAAALEARLTAATARNMRPLLVITDVPAYAGTACHLTDVGLIDLRDFIEDVVTRYSLPPFQVSQYILFTDIDTCFTPADYAAALAVAYPKVKAANENAELLIGRLTLVPAQGSFFPNLLAAGAPFDGVAFDAFDVAAQYVTLWGEHDGFHDEDWAGTWYDGPAIITRTQWLQSQMTAYGITGKRLIAWVGVQDVPMQSWESLTSEHLAQVYGFAATYGVTAIYEYGDLVRQTPSDSLWFYTDLARNVIANNTVLGAVTPAEIGGWTDMHGFKFRDRQDYTERWLLWTTSYEFSYHEAAFSRVPFDAYNAFGVPQAIMPEVNVSTLPVVVFFAP